MKRADGSSHGNLAQLRGFSQDGTKPTAPIGGFGQASNAQMGANTAS